MKRLQGLYFLIILFLFCLFVYFFSSLSTEVNAGYYQHDNEILSITPLSVITEPSISSTSTITIQSMPTQQIYSSILITFDQLKQIQESVLDTTRKSLEVTLTTITILLGIMTLFVTLLTAVAGVMGITVYRRISDAAKRAEKVIETVDKIEERANEYELLVSTNSSEVFKLKNEYSSLKVNFESTKNEINEIYEQRKKIGHDTQYIRDTLILVNLEERSVELFGDDPDEIDKAVKALTQMTDKSYKSYIRRRSVDMLSQYVILKPNIVIITCLKKVALHDSSASVKRIANETLKKLKGDSNLAHEFRYILDS